MRVKGGKVTRRRHKKFLKMSKGYRGALSKTYRQTRQALLHALSYAKRHRREKKRDWRYLWNVRINAGARANGLSYSRLIGGLKKAGIALDRKVLAQIAYEDAPTFARIVEAAKA